MKKRIIYLFLLLNVVSTNYSIGQIGNITRPGVYVPSEPNLTPPSTVFTDTLKAVLIMGQSNISGRANISTLPADIENPFNLARYYENGITSPFDIVGGEPMTEIPNNQAFAHDAVWLQRLSETVGDTIYFAKKCHGGSSFFQTDNVKGDWNVSSVAPEDHFREFRRRILSLKNYAKSKNKYFKPLAMVVDIFETDSDLSDTATLTQDFKNFISEIRSLVNDPNLPIIHRELSSNQLGVAQFAIDLQNFLSVNSEAQGGLDNYILIDSAGTVFFDGTHLDSASNELMSDRILPILLSLY